MRRCVGARLLCTKRSRTGNLPVVQQKVDRLLAANKKWVDTSGFPFHQLKGNHKPEYLWCHECCDESEFRRIGCADARVPPDLLLGQNPGKIFVHRNIANMVQGIDVTSDVRLIALRST